MEAGKWRIKRIELTSVALGIELMYEVEGEYLRVPQKYYRGKKFAEFTVQTKAEPDYEAPKLDIDKMTMTKINDYKGKKPGWRFRVYFKDGSGSKVRWAICDWDSYKKGEGQMSFEDYFLRYNESLQCYEMEMGDYLSEDSCEELTSIRVCDLYGNEKKYYAIYPGKDKDVMEEDEDDFYYVEEEGIDFSRFNIYSSEEMREYMEEHPQERDH